MIKLLFVWCFLIASFQSAEHKTSPTLVSSLGVAPTVPHKPLSSSTQFLKRHQRIVKSWPQRRQDRLKFQYYPPKSTSKATIPDGILRRYPCLKEYGYKPSQETLAPVTKEVSLEGSPSQVLQHLVLNSHSYKNARKMNITMKELALWRDKAWINSLCNELKKLSMGVETILFSEELGIDILGLFAAQVPSLRLVKTPAKRLFFHAQKADWVCELRKEVTTLSIDYLKNAMTFFKKNSIYKLVEINFITEQGEGIVKVFDQANGQKELNIQNKKLRGGKLYYYIYMPSSLPKRLGITCRLIHNNKAFYSFGL